MLEENTKASDSMDETSEKEQADSIDQEPAQNETEPETAGRRKSGFSINGLYKTVYENCRVRLTNDELRMRGQQLVDARNKEQAEINRHKIEKDVHKENIGQINLDISRFHQAIDNGWEWRELPCFERPLYSEALVAIVRRDTLEVVSSRPMTDKERQLAFFE